MPLCSGLSMFQRLLLHFRSIQNCCHGLRRQTTHDFLCSGPVLQSRGWFAGACPRDARSACPGANHDVVGRERVVRCCAGKDGRMRRRGGDGSFSVCCWWISCRHPSAVMVCAGRPPTTSVAPATRCKVVGGSPSRTMTWIFYRGGWVVTRVCANAFRVFAPSRAKILLCASQKHRPWLAGTSPAMTTGRSYSPCSPAKRALISGAPGMPVTLKPASM
jgi:hypothetical protein